MTQVCRDPGRGCPWQSCMFLMRRGANLTPGLVVVGLFLCLFVKTASIFYDPEASKIMDAVSYAS